MIGIYTVAIAFVGRPKEVRAIHFPVPPRSATYSNKMNFAMPFDCSRLLRYAVRAEADCAAAAAAGSHIDNRSAAAAATTTTSFGHPDPPSLHLFALDDSEPSTSTPTTSSATVVPDGTLLVVAFTKHTVSAQLLWTRNNNSNKKHSGVVQDDVKELCVLLPEDETLLTTIDENGDNDEHIRCLTVVALKRKHQQQLLQIAVSSAASTSITSSSSLMKGVVYVKSETTEASATATSAAPMSRPQPPQGDEELRRLAIVFGTNYSRVYTVEVTISFSTTNKQWVLQRSQLHDATSSHSSVFQVFPMDDSNNAMLIRRRSCKRTSTHTNKQEHGPAVTPFRPVGGVVCLSCYQDWIVWITYGDATLLRVHGSSFFPSLWQRAAAGGWSVEDCVRWLHPNIRPLVRCQVRLPCDEPVLVVPLPRHFPSLLTTLKTILPPSAPRSAPHGDEECRNGDPKIDDYETQQRAAAMEETYEALVFGQGTSSLFPTLCFYTSVGPLDGRDGDSNAGGSRNESFDFASPSRDDGRILGSVTKALVGSAMGALRWGFGSGSSDNSRNAASKLDYFSQSQVSDSEGRDSAGFKGTDYDTSERTVASSPFPSLWSRPVNLHASFEFHDAPRKVEFCSIDPDGRLAAAADGLGRVLLIDLASKQLIRMWKGFRDASCYWLQTESPRQQRPTNEPISPWRHGKQKKPLLHLVIHSRQRRVVEVWRVRHGSRVCSIQVGRGSRILPCISLSALREPLVSCYLIHSTIPGTNHNQMEQIRVDCEEAVTTFHDAPPRSVSSTKAASVASNPSRQAALRLQHLQQLLSAGNIQYSAEDVRKALHEIKSLSDLSTALDLLAAGSVLEEQLGVKGSTFHRDALTYCRGVLNAAMHRGKSRSDTAARANPHVQILSHKIEYHTQVGES